MSAAVTTSVLMIDDDRADYLLIRKMLNGSRFQLEWVSSRQELAQLGNLHRFQAILLDQHLGDELGLELLADLRAQGIAAPAIALTGSYDQQIERLALQSGVVDHLVKGEFSSGTLERCLLYAVERHRHLKALQESELRYRAVVESSHDAIIVYDDQGGIVDANESACQWLRIRQGASLSSPPSPLWENLPHGQPTGQLQISFPDGHQRHVQYSRIHQYLPNRHLLALRDITSEVESQRQLNERAEQLRQAQKMEAVGRLAGGLAHDFNNLLLVIKGYSELLTEAPVQNDEYVREIINAADRGMSLTRQLLAISRRQMVHPVAVPLNATIRSMKGLLTRLATKEIHLEIHLSPEEIWIEIDPGQLEQILLNLVVNARDAVGEIGQASQSSQSSQSSQVGKVRIRTEAHQGQACLQVEDNGMGISPDILDQIFEPFFSTKGSEGSGLGLAVVYGIVQSNHGRIRVDSRPQQGSRFSLEFPLLQNHPASAAPTTSPEPTEEDQPRLRILVVEDEPKLRSLVKRLLERKNYEVLTAEHGLQALEILGNPEELVDLVISDVRMPVLGGLEMAERLRQTRPQLPILFTSGYNPEGPLDSRHFLPKPYSTEQLMEAVQEALKGQDDHAVQDTCREAYSGSSPASYTTHRKPYSKDAPDETRNAGSDSLGTPR